MYHKGLPRGRICGTFFMNHLILLNILAFRHKFQRQNKFRGDAFEGVLMDLRCSKIKLR